MFKKYKYVSKTKNGYQAQFQYKGKNYTKYDKNELNCAGYANYRNKINNSKSV